LYPSASYFFSAYSFVPCFGSGAFGAAATNSLNPLMDAVKAAREQMDMAARTVAGEQAMPMAPGGMAPPADLGAGAAPGAVP
jgi:hypothetical protein